MNQGSESSHPPHDELRITDCLRMDAWSVHEGLSEIVRDYSPTLSGKDVLASLQFYSRLKSIWDSGDHPPGKLPPAYFVAWAAKKKFPLSWAKWAKNEGWLDDKPVVTALCDAKRRLIGRRGIADARAALEGSASPVSIQLPRLSSKLADALNVFSELCEAGSLPMQKALAAALDERWGKAGAEAATTEARTLATLLLGDVTIRLKRTENAA